VPREGARLTERCAAAFDSSEVVDYEGCNCLLPIVADLLPIKCLIINDVTDVAGF
jgi:hypothetical protein